MVQRETIRFLPDVFKLLAMSEGSDTKISSTAVEYSCCITQEVSDKVLADSKDLSKKYISLRHLLTIVLLYICP